MMALLYLACAVATAITGVVLDRFLVRRHAEWRERNALDLSNCLQCGQFREHGHECERDV